VGFDVGLRFQSMSAILLSCDMTYHTIWCLKSRIFCKKFLGFGFWILGKSYGGG